MLDMKTIHKKKKKIPFIWIVVAIPKLFLLDINFKYLNKLKPKLTAK